MSRIPIQTRCVIVHAGTSLASSRFKHIMALDDMVALLRMYHDAILDFDAQGFERRTDYARMLRIVLDAGYRGYVGIEYEGKRLPEREGIKACRDLLTRLRI